MDRGAWQAAVHGVSKSRTRLGNTAQHTQHRPCRRQRGRSKLAPHSHKASPWDGDGAPNMTETTMYGYLPAVSFTAGADPRQQGLWEARPVEPTVTAAQVWWA